MQLLSTIRQQFRLAMLVTVCLFPLMARPAIAGDQRQTVGPPEVYAQVGVIRAELEAIRFVMGRPKNTQQEIAVRGAEPREVYFQALTLFRKSDRLCFEHTRERIAEPGTPIHPLTSADVHEVVTAALGRIRKVKRTLRIEQSQVIEDPNVKREPTDVFRSIVQANRQLNLLLERQFTPSDVFQQVTRGVACTSRLLERFPAATSIPQTPQFEEGKRPADVYRRLVTCLNRVRRIAARSGEQTLEFEPDEKQIERAEPSDVYDVASLLVSELAYLHSQSGANRPRKSYYPGRKYPSHVFQRAGILERQLVELESVVKQNPQWLEHTARGS